MSGEIEKEYQAILNQLHSNVFLERLTDQLDPDGKSDWDEADSSELNDLARRLLVEDASPSIDNEVIQKLLEDEEFRNNLLEATRSMMNSNR
tara:strand:+ start:5469 stop:5744 length:276 start_codon:yes stop_codon:yes gene_type:complete